MLPYASVAAAEAALGRNLTTAETIWFLHSADMPDYLLYYHNTLFLFIIFTLVPLPLALLDLYMPSLVSKYKIQPNVYLSRSQVVNCYTDVIKLFSFLVCPLTVLTYPTAKMIGIRTGLPLPSKWEVFFQLSVYFMIEDYGSYWIHRCLHWKWLYDRLHKGHHQYPAPIGYATPYGDWSEVVILGIPTFVGPAIVPGHMVTLWLWIALRQIEAIDTHCGYNFPVNFTKIIPFYGGAEFHDYHHYVGEQSRNNFASVFTYCDYIYGTDKGYRHRKRQLAKVA